MTNSQSDSDREFREEQYQNYNQLNQIQALQMAHRNEQRRSEPQRRIYLHSGRARNHYKIKTSKQGTIYFPYNPPYALQQRLVKFMSKCLEQKKNCLIQSPTGTGKTMSLICASLGWMYEGNKKRSDVNKIIYLSKNHNQLAQIEKQIKKSCYRPGIAYLGSRKHSCCNQELTHEHNGDKINQKCNQKAQIHQMLVKLRLNPKLRAQCGYTEQQLRQKQKEVCKYYSNYNKQQRKEVNKQIFKQLEGSPITFQQQNSCCQKKNTCPYLYTYPAKYYADFIVMPYDYLLNKNILKKNKDILDKSVVIFDEGHNIQEKAAEGMSFQIHESTLNRVTSSLQNIKKWTKQQTQKSAQKLLFDLQKQQQYIHQRLSSSEQKMRSDLQLKLKRQRQKIQNDAKLKRKKLAEISQLCQDVLEILNRYAINFTLYMDSMKVSLDNQQQQYESDKQIVKKCFQDITEQTLNLFLNLNNDPTPQIPQYKQKLHRQFDEIHAKLGKIFNEMLLFDKRQYQFESSRDFLQMLEDIVIMGTLKEDFGMFLKFKKKKKKNDEYQWVPFLYYKCFNPSLIFREIIGAGTRSIIITSGTLSPLSNWSKYLGIEFEIPTNCGQQHIIPLANQRTLIVTHQKNNNRRQKIYLKSKDIYKQYQSIYSWLKQTDKFIPEGKVVILPSKKHVQKFLDYHQTLQNANDKKIKNRCIFDSQKSAEWGLLKNLNILTQKLRIQCKNSHNKGFMLFTYFRGTLSEGIDFKDELCRAIFIIGVPEKPPTDIMRDRIMKYHNERHDKDNQMPDGQTWSIEQVYRTINQGIGRIIRHAKDFGIVYLMDYRYCQQHKGYKGRKRQFYANISNWAKKNIKTIDLDQIQRQTKQFCQKLAVPIQNGRFVI